MNEADLLAAAAQHARASKIPVGAWVHLIQAAPHTAPYKWRNTEWGKALLALEAVKNLPTPAPSLSLQRTIFWASLTDDAVQHASRLGNTWRHALTADPAYAPTLGQVNALKAASAGVDVWGNQSEIPFATFVDFHVRWGLDRIILQAETAAEYETAMKVWGL